MTHPKSTAASAVRDWPVLQWVMAGIGGLITLAVTGVVLWEAVQPSAPAVLEARVVRIDPAATGYLAEIEVSNTGRETAAAVDVAGALAGRPPSTVTIDYVPARGRATAWLRFEQDPAGASVAVVGWSEP